MCDPSIHYLSEQTRTEYVFFFFLPSHSSSFLLSAKPVVWRPAHGSNDASCGQWVSPPAVPFSDRCAGWKQLLEFRPGGVLSNLSVSSVLVPTQSGDAGARVAQVGRIQACYPTSNSFLCRSHVSVVTGVFGNELWLTLQVFFGCCFSLDGNKGAVVGTEPVAKQFFVTAACRTK